MRTWITQTTVIGLPDEVLALLTEPDAIARWTPVPFELIDLEALDLAVSRIGRQLKPALAT